MVMSKESSSKGGGDRRAVPKTQPGLVEDRKRMSGLDCSIREYFRSSMYSDMKIVTKNREFKVHKLVVCGQSGFFTRALRNDWVEAKTNTINLADDDPTAIEAMIYFMYGFNYDSSVKDQDRASPMLFNISVYQIGDKYDIPKLKSQAREKFIRGIETSWKSKDFPLAIADAYRKTVPTDRGLRNPIVKITLSHIDWLRKEKSFQQVLRETIDFAADLVESKEQKAKPKVHKCPHCLKTCAITSPVSPQYCLLCGSSYSKTARPTLVFGNHAHLG